MSNTVPFHDPGGGHAHPPPGQAGGQTPTPSGNSSGQGITGRTLLTGIGVIVGLIVLAVMFGRCSSGPSSKEVAAQEAVTAARIKADTEPKVDTWATPFHRAIGKCEWYVAEKQILATRPNQPDSTAIILGGPGKDTVKVEWEPGIWHFRSADGKAAIMKFITLPGRRRGCS